MNIIKEMLINRKKSRKINVTEVYKKIVKEIDVHCLFQKLIINLSYSLRKSLFE